MNYLELPFAGIVAKLPNSSLGQHNTGTSSQLSYPYYYFFHKNIFYAKLELVNFREISPANNLCSLSRVLCYQPAIEQPDGAPHTH
jgi:hypothetical protein